MKKLYFCLLMLLFCGAFAEAQDMSPRRMTVDERAKKVTEWMIKELNLKGDQIPAVDSVNLVFTKAQQVLFQAAEGDREKMRDSMKALEEEKIKSLAGILTPEQLEKYKEETMNFRKNFRRKDQ